jgi:hypothetical protein
VQKRRGSLRLHDHPTESDTQSSDFNFAMTAAASGQFIFKEKYSPPLNSAQRQTPQSLSIVFLNSTIAWIKGAPFALK